MKPLLFALLLSVAFCSSIEVTLTGKPMANQTSCDLSYRYYYFWLPANHTGFEEDTTFNFLLIQPNNALAQCTICADRKTGSNCTNVTCVFDINKNPLKKATVELPTTLNTDLLEFDLNGWDTYVAPNTVVATDVDCTTSFLGYSKVGAILLVALFLF